MAVNQVDILRFYLDCDDPAFGHYFNRECGRLIDTVLPSIIDEELAPYARADEYIHIPVLEVDVDGVEATQFFDGYPERFRQALREALATLFSERTDVAIVRREQPDEWWEAWKAFLLTGQMPWHLASGIRAMRDVFGYVLQHHADALKVFLRRYGHVTSLQQRLVYQLEDAQIKQLIGALQPTAREFITSYADTLIAKYRKAPVREVSESDYRNAVWLVILAYLLTDRSSFFDKKNFLRWTIGRLAAKYNTAYSFILDHLVEDLHAFVAGNIHYPDLVLLLHELQKESPNRVDIQPRRAVLIRILSDPDSCQTYIERLSERAIRQLVYVVVASPSDAAFVVDYADLLDQQRDTIVGHRAGKAFQKLKWRIIFPLLSMQTVTTLDQRHFVRAVIAGIAAHYNLNVRQLVEWLHPFWEEFPVNKNVRLLMRAWHEELQAPEALDRNADSGKPSVLSRAALAQWQARLQDPNRRLSALAELADADHGVLLARLFPAGHRFVLGYAQSLDEWVANNGIPAPATATAWPVVKWGFIYGVLFDTQHQVFNKKYLVRRVAQQLAAHYNMRLADLLALLRETVMLATTAFSFDLVSVIVELHGEAVGKTGTPAEEKGRALFRKYYGAQASYVALIGKMAFSETFLAIATRLVTWETMLFEKMQRAWGSQYDRAVWLRLLVDVSKKLQAYTFGQVLARLLAMMAAQVRTATVAEAWQEALVQLAKAEPFVAAYLREAEEELPATAVSEASDVAEMTEAAAADSCFVQNAGLVMLAPFLPRLFATAGLLDERKRAFRDRDSQIHAIFMLQYAVFAEGAFPEFELELNKLLTGFKTGVPIPQQLALSDAEKMLVTDMLTGVLHHWKKLNHSSVAALRVSFLQRGGRIQAADDQLHLHVESQSYDMLLDSLPWQFRIIRHPWMKMGLYVTWR